MSKKRLCIATDTNCCFSKEEIEANELKVLSMEFLIDGKIYKEGIDLTHEEFYHFLENDVNVSTSQPTPFALQEFFDEILKEYDFSKKIKNTLLKYGIEDGTRKLLSRGYDLEDIKKEIQ